MIQKKVCMLGAFATGKTSLVQRYVSDTYRDRYLTTVGVKVSSRDVEVRGHAVKLLLWDIHGEDAFQQVRSGYLRGANGCFLVVDGTRRATLNTALELAELARNAAGDVPLTWLLNKSDLESEWELRDEELSVLGQAKCIKTSAKNATGVDEAFTDLVTRMVLR